MGFWWTTCSDYVSFVLPFTVLYNYLLKAGHDVLSNRNWDKENVKAKLHVNLTNDQSLFNASAAVGARGFTFSNVPGFVFSLDFDVLEYPSSERICLAAVSSVVCITSMVLEPCYCSDQAQRKRSILITNTSFSVSSWACFSELWPSEVFLLLDHFFPFGEKRRLHRMRERERGMPSPWFWGKIPGLGRCPEEGGGYPFQYSGLENSMTE